ncbi:LPS export ABC transporter periplasmic protein LptC [Permianibacter sp. IMCC34836]|uniref:LPS export ABC transporter periplasmic protein LptC n=1 Tax=Permianibacter fluminis TaxID=2738515 RepID=UPI0015577122|nr:LPS export ABC transporter periplasmic protein LptC [Permianibacter fluminis]NQD39026.1 LPS export ABC transporter periplasmic protein LptC [Permianibacter fluminis]
MSQSADRDKPTESPARASVEVVTRKVIALNWRGVIIGAGTLLVALVVLTVLNREQAGKNQPTAAMTEALQEARSDYYMEGIVSRHFDSAGQLSHVLTAPRIDHFQDQKRSQIQQPRIELVRADGKPWEVAAEFADAELGSDQLTLNKQVSLSRAGSDGVPALRMETDTLTVDMNARTADTAARINFVSPNGRVSATGLHANLATEQLQLLADVKGHYEKTTP